MLSRAINGFSSADVEAAYKGKSGSIIYRWRFESVDRDGNKIRDLSNVILDGSGEVRYKSTADTDVQGSAVFKIEEADLTTDDVANIDDYSAMVIAAGPLFYLRHQETSGTTATDLSGNGRNFTYSGSITFSAPFEMADASNVGVRGDGSTAYAFIADAAWMDVTALSLIRWWKGTGTSRALIDRDDGGSNRFFRFAINASGNVALTLTFTSGSPATKTFTATGAVNDNEEHMLGASYDGAYVRIYIDGINVLKTAETRTLATGTLGINIGRTNESASRQYDNGTGDESAIFGRALTASEFRNLWQAGSGDLAEIDYGQDLIVPYLAIKMTSNATSGTTIDTPWAEMPLGHFILSSPNRSRNDTGIKRPIEGFDKNYILKNITVTERYTIANGTNYLTAVATLLTAAGFDSSQYTLGTTSNTLPSALEFPIGTSYLEIINHLLKAINFYPFHWNYLGKGVAAANTLPSSRTAEFTFTTDNESVIQPEVEVGLDLESVYNQVTLFISDSDITRPLTKYTATNNKWSSPVSVPRRGGRIKELVEPVDAADATVLQSLTEARLTQVSQIHQTVDFSIHAFPFFSHDDLVNFTHSGVSNALEISDNFSVSERVIKLLDPPGEKGMQLSLDKVVSVI